MSEISWNNLTSLESFKKLTALNKPISLANALSGENGAKRVATSSVPMGAGLCYNYAAKQVDEKVLSIFSELTKEAQLLEKFESLYNGEIVNTGEKRMVLHHLTRGQLGKDVIVDGVNKRDFYVKQQNAIADFAKKVHSGEIKNENGENQLEFRSFR